MCGDGIDPISVDQFKEFFPTQFNYTVITDSQILTIMQLACTQIAGCLIGSKVYTFAFYYLTAFFLFKQYGNAITGDGSDSESNAVGIVGSESQDDQSLGYTLPDKFLKSPNWYFYSTNKYGLNYLQLVYPYTVGRVFTVFGRSTIT